MTLAEEIRADFKRACKLPDKLTPSQWAERFRVLYAEAGCAEPGPWRNERTPYLVGIMDAWVEPGVEDVVVVAATRTGKSESFLNIMGFCICEDPGPMLLVMPSEGDIKEVIKEQLKPLIEKTPAVRQMWSGDPHDITQTGIRLATMSIYPGWGGSPGSLARRTCRYVGLDEIDKFPPFAGREADPVSLAKERTSTYQHRKRHYLTSTPTTREGKVWVELENCGDRRRYHVPCPHCGEYQLLVFPQIKWEKIDEADKVKRADAIQQNKSAWYECRACKGRILDHHKPKMLQAGRWLSETQTINKGGEIAGYRPRSKRVGFHLNALYSPWRTFSDIAATFIRADGDPGATMNFRNSWLAEPFENLVTKPRPDVIRQKALGAGQPGIVPTWAQLLVATADMQKDWFKLHIGAWGWGYRYQLVMELVVYTFDELYRAALEAQFQVEGGGLANCRALLIDTGGTRVDGVSRTDEAYQFALRDPGRIIPCKGSSHTMRRPWTMSQLPNGVTLRLIDTEYFKDMLSRLINDPDPTKWMPHRDVTDQYCLEMASEHKIIDRKSSRMMWVPVSAGVRCESWDCEVLQCAAADMANIGAMPAEAVQQQPAPPPTPRDRPDWMPDRPTNWLNR